MEVELFYTRHNPGVGNLLRSDDVGEFPSGAIPRHWTTEEWAHADRADRLFRAWNCVRRDDYADWVAFAAIVDSKRIVLGVEAVRELTALAEASGRHANREWSAVTFNGRMYMVNTVTGELFPSDGRAT